MIDYNNERGKSNKACHKPALKCFSFYFFVKNGWWDTITKKCIYAYNLLNVKGAKSNGVSAEKIQRSFTLLKYVCMYVCIHLLSIKNH